MSKLAKETWYKYEYAMNVSLSPCGDIKRTSLTEALKELRFIVVERYGFITMSDIYEAIAYLRESEHYIKTE